MLGYIFGFGGICLCVGPHDRKPKNLTFFEIVFHNTQRPRSDWLEHGHARGLLILKVHL